MGFSNQYKIYVACLASYNNGWLHGRWIDATQGVDHINEQVEEMLKESPVTKEYGEIAEEWAIHDYELGGIRISESEDFDRVAEIGDLLQNAEFPQAVIAYVIGENEGVEMHRIMDIIEERYVGEYDNVEDYARQFCEEVGDSVPDWLENYVDYAAMGRDWEYSGDIDTIDNGHNSIYVLRRY